MYIDVVIDPVADLKVHIALGFLVLPNSTARTDFPL